MSEVKFTPGPWRMVKSSVNYRTHVYVLRAKGIPHHATSDEHVIGSIDLNDHYSHNWQFPEGEDSYNNSEINAEANAKLIAASPELLKALMKSKNIIEFLLSNIGDAAPIEYRNVLKEIESAINKATS